MGLPRLSVGLMLLVIIINTGTIKYLTFNHPCSGGVGALPQGRYARNIFLLFSFVGGGWGGTRENVYSGTVMAVACGTCTFTNTAGRQCTWTSCFILYNL